MEAAALTERQFLLPNPGAIHVFSREEYYCQIRHAIQTAELETQSGCEVTMLH
jgi:hypothetical protein